MSRRSCLANSCVSAEVLVLKVFVMQVMMVEECPKNRYNGMNFFVKTKTKRL